MSAKKLCVFNWSGGKDSTLALHHILEDDSFEVKYLLTTISKEFDRVSMHGLRVSLLRQQAKSIGIKLYEIYLPENATMESYTNLMNHHLLKLKEEGITHSIFGDIFLEDIKIYREKQHTDLGIKAIFPLWARDTDNIITEFLNLNYRTVIVCAQENLASYCGKIIDKELITSFPLEIDVCGENGEFHTFAFEGPIFKSKIMFSVGEKVRKTYTVSKTVQLQGNQTKPLTENIGYWFTDLVDN